MVIGIEQLQRINKYSWEFAYRAMYLDSGKFNCATVTQIRNIAQKAGIEKDINAFLDYLGKVKSEYNPPLTATDDELRAQFNKRKEVFDKWIEYVMDTINKEKLSMNEVSIIFKYVLWNIDVLKKKRYNHLDDLMSYLKAEFHDVGEVEYFMNEIKNYFNDMAKSQPTGGRRKGRRHGGERRYHDRRYNRGYGRKGW